jgi:hypothetical protein
MWLVPPLLLLKPLTGLRLRCQWRRWSRCLLRLPWLLLLPWLRRASLLWGLVHGRRGQRRSRCLCITRCHRLYERRSRHHHPGGWRQ